MSPTIAQPNVDAGAPPPISIEQLIVEAEQSYPEELRNARGVIKDEAATTDLKGDADRMGRLAELAEVDADQIADVAVRGTNVTFVVLEGDEGVPSSGFFPLAALAGDSRARRAARTGAKTSAQTSAKTRRGAVGHGTADPSPVIPEDNGGDDDDTGDEPLVNLNARGAVAELQAEDTTAERKAEIAQAEYDLPAGERRKTVVDALIEQGHEPPSTE